MGEIGEISDPLFPVSSPSTLRSFVEFRKTRVKGDWLRRLELRNRKSPISPISPRTAMASIDRRVHKPTGLPSTEHHEHMAALAFSRRAEV
jgi:hypothetical protein